MNTEKLDPGRLIDLTRELTELEPRLAEIGTATAQLDGFERERADLISKLSKQRLAENKLRRSTVDLANARLKDKLRVQVTYKGAKREYKAALVALLKGSSVSGDAVELLVAPEATDGAALARSVRKSAAAVQADFGVSVANSDRLVEWLNRNQGSDLRELDRLAPADSVTVELIVDGASRDLDRLSMGQRATAILLLLFALEGRLLILDQPEDDLDNRFVYEDVVTLLRDQKGLVDPALRRQVIAATHNPNIPVLGDAEQVLVLDVEEGRSVLLQSGSIDAFEVRQHLRTVLEGGEEAFKRRAEKYGSRST